MKNLTLATFAILFVGTLAHASENKRIIVTCSDGDGVRVSITKDDNGALEAIVKTMSEGGPLIQTGPTYRKITVRQFSDTKNSSMFQGPGPFVLLIQGGPPSKTTPKGYMSNLTAGSFSKYVNCEYKNKDFLSE